MTSPNRIVLYQIHFDCSRHSYSWLIGISLYVDKRMFIQDTLRIGQKLSPKTSMYIDR